MTVSVTFSQFSADLAALVEGAAPSVAGVRSGASLASGTVAGRKHVVVASHALDPEASTVDVWIQGTVSSARVLGRDASTDLAVLQVEGLAAPGLTPGEEPAVGAVVLSVGRAWDRLVAHVGIVHTRGVLQRRRASRREGILQTTITPYPGYSGGPLLDARGAVVGLAIAGPHRTAGLALPWPTVMRLVGEIETHGRIRRGFLGVSSMPVVLAPGQAGPHDQRAGLLVTSVVSDGPAAAAGVLVGDVLVEFDGHAVSEPDALVNLLTGERVGHATPVTVVRGLALHVLSVTVGERETQLR
jgi:S1-C subfamily serine protease